jgi:hypothetical protein
MAKASRSTRSVSHQRPSATGGPRPRRATESAAITLIYLRPANAEETVLDGILAEVVRRYGPRVELETVASEDAGRFARWCSTGSPAVLLMRRGAVIGQAIGAALPARELDRAVRRAVEWPAR